MADDNTSLSLSSDRYSFKDYLKYQRELQFLNENDSRKRFFNESDIHAAIVVNEILKRAMKYNQSIEMFCGSFYLFRDEFKTRVDDEKSKMKVEIVGGDRNDFSNFKPFDDLIQSLKEFFDNGLKMDVVLEKEGAFEGIQGDSKWKSIFRPRMWDKSLHFYRLDSNLRNIHDHFIVSGYSFRKEISESNRTALCSFNRPEYANMYLHTFELMKGMSRECRVF